jgi:hypothetical protein
MSKIWTMAARAGKQALERVVGADAYHALRTRRRLWLGKWQGKQPLFVHQMGKVGSSSIMQTLRASPVGGKLAIYHSHYLSPEGMSFVEQLEAEGYGGAERLPYRTRRYLIKSRTLSRQVYSEHFRKQRVKVITLVRDPVATNLSGFFYNAAWWPPALQSACRDGAPGYAEQLTGHFLDHYPHDVPLRWFDLEMAPVFGIDVFATPFAQSTGYQIYQGEWVDLLLLKLECLNECAGPALGDFLNLETVALQRVNEAGDKWYAALYKSYTDALSLPADYLARLYQSRFTRHFYHEDEVAAFTARWTKS